MFKHIIRHGEEARSKFLEGAKKAALIVGSTLGPKGRNVIIEEKYHYPLVHNDGVNVARKIVLEDPVEDLAYQTIVNVAMSQNEMVGDGTTTAVLLASNLLITGFERIQSDITGGDPVGMGEAIVSEGKRAVEILKKESRPLKKGELEDVITTSLRDREFSKTIAEMMESLGKDCYISVEDNWKTRYGIETESITGVKKLGSYANRFFVNSKNGKESTWNDAHVLVTNHKIEAAAHLSDLFMNIQKSGKLRLVIITNSPDGDSFGQQFVAKIAKVISVSRQGSAGDALEILPIRAPALTSDEMEDIAAFTNAKFINSSLASLMDIKMRDLGYAQRVVVDEDNFLVMGGKGDTKERVKVLSEQMEIEKDPMFKEKLARRISSLSEGAGVIRVGAMTEAERSFKKMKIEDAVNTAKAALEEGVVPGGGQTLVKIAKELGKESIIYPALVSIQETLERNAGKGFKVGKDVLDSTKVVRLAIESACSAASRVIAADTGIAKRPRTLIDEFEKLMHHKDEEDDFRDDSNQDLGSGRSIR